MWLTLALLSAFLLGFYDITKKKALRKNPSLTVLLIVTGISTVLLSPCLFLYGGPLRHHLMVMVKAVIVTASWVSGIIALKLLPITTVSPLKATRPFFVVLLSVILFGERLGAMQWAGVALALLSIALISFPAGRDGGREGSRGGYTAIAISIVTGVISALYDKHIIAELEPLFVQSWGNLYITALIALCIAVKSLTGKSGGISEWKVSWDWMLLLTALLITGADMTYFFALKCDGALLSVISILRRCSVIVTFVFGAIVFRERKNLTRKAVCLGILLAGMALLMVGSA